MADLPPSARSEKSAAHDDAGEFWRRAIRNDVPAPRSDAVERGRGRLVVVAAAALVGLASILCKLASLSLGDASSTPNPVPRPITEASRADIIDRNGELVARDLDFYDVSIKPARLRNRDRTAEELARLIPESASALKRRFKNSEFAYIQRNATPKEAEAIHGLGLPGAEFQPRPRRTYPKAALLSHVVGYVNLDNRGTAGIERSQDSMLRERGHDGEPLRLSIDTAVQFAVRQIIGGGIAEYGAVAGVGIVLDVRNGEIYAMVSLPDFDPHNPGKADDEGKRNRASGAVYEMGSVFKPFTFATGFEHGSLGMHDSFDARQPLKIGRRIIHDFHAENRWLSTEEVFIHSSNIGTAKIAIKFGPDVQREYLGKLGLLNKSPVELPEVEKPLVQSHWGTIEGVTISYGYGISVTPLQVASGVGALVNGGYYVAPTVFKRSAGAAFERRQVITGATGEKIRELMRANVLDGTGKTADIEGYDVGGKTGTANKEESGGYSGSKRVASFVAAFPINAPRFLVLVMLDEPTRVPGIPGQVPTGGATAAPLCGLIIRRIAPILGMPPELRETTSAQNALKHG